MSHISSDKENANSKFYKSQYKRKKVCDQQYEYFKDFNVGYKMALIEQEQRTSKS